MIEVNLLPGARKGASKGLSFSLPKLSLGGGGGDTPDPYMIFFAVAAAVGVGYMGWAFLGVTNEAEELEVRVEEERQEDSIRFQAIIEQTNRLTARRDSIAARASIIQDIDQDRFVWPHVMDEVGAAVPEFLWLREVIYAGDSPLQVRIAGRAGSLFAITNFMRRLEASEFLMGAELQSTQQQPSEENPDDLVQSFELLVSYQAPALELLETVPLFDDASASAQSAAPTGN